jgi:hypothetical protein
MEYKVIDADGHILEPPDLWESYSDPRFRDDCPKLIVTEGGGEIFKIEGDDAFDLGRGKKKVRLGGLGTIGARAGGINPQRVPYAEGRRGGFDAPETVSTFGRYLPFNSAKSSSTSSSSGKRPVAAFEKISFPSTTTSNCPVFPALI